MTWSNPSFCDPVAPAAGQLRATSFPGQGYWQRCSGARRGVALNFPGSSLGPVSKCKPADINLGSPPVLRSQVGGDADSGLFVNYSGSFLANLLNDGWDVFNVGYPELGAGGTLTPPNIPEMALANEFATDPAFGARYLAETQRMTELHVQGISNLYGQGVPIIITGGSHGGLSGLIAAQYLGNRIKGFWIYAPAMQSNIASLLWTYPANLNTINCSGIAIPNNFLGNFPTVPGLANYGTNDNVVGFSRSAVASGSIGVNVATWTAGSGTLDVVDGTQFITTLGSVGGNLAAGPCVLVPTNSPVGFAIVEFVGITGNTLTQCTTLFGSGNIVAGTAVQNNIQDIVAAAPASVVLNPTNDTHTIGFLTAGSYFPLTGPTALTSLGTLTLGCAIDGSGLTSGHVQVRDTVGNWHTVSFTGTGTTTVSGLTVTTLTGCTYSGSTSAFLSLGSLIVSTGPTTQSMAWWLTQNVDPGLPLAWSY